MPQERYPTAKELHKDDLKYIIHKQYGHTDSIETLSDGSVLISQDGSFSKVTAQQVQQLTQRQVHQDGQDRQDKTKAIRDQIAADPNTQRGYDAAIRDYDHRQSGARNGNPFHGKSEREKLSPSNYGTPEAVRHANHTGLPSDRKSSAEYRMPSQRPSTIAQQRTADRNSGLLPSDPNFKA